MGKIAKTIQPKHKETLTPWLQNFVQTATDTPLPQLPQYLSNFPTRWPFPRGDLYHWIPLLNRFDDVLESFCAVYKLKDGAQSRDFGCDILLGANSTSKDDAGLWDTRKLAELGFKEDGDSSLIVAILKFTQMLLDHCGNRSIYASSSHLNDLLNSTDFNIVCATLRVGVELAQRYQASVKRMNPTSRQVNSALLTNHYNIDLDRVQQLAQPFIKTPIIKPTEPQPLATPISSSGKKGGSGLKNTASMYANDLCAIAKPSSTEFSSDSGPDARWNGWGDVKVSYYPTTNSSLPTENFGPSERANASQPSTPTPLRRSNTAGGPHSTPRAARQPAADDSPSPSTRSPALGSHEFATPGQKSLDIPQSTVVSTPIYKLLERMPSDLSKDTRYEFLNRLRIAKALTGTVEARQGALKARLLAIQNLAYIHFEAPFTEKVLKHDHDEPRRFQLVYQLAELIHPSPEGTPQVPTGLQAIALSLLEAISGFHSKIPDIFSALNATVNHGVLLYVIRKAVAEMREDDTGEQWTDEDEWRDNLFSLTLHITMAMTNNSSRTTPEIISAGLLEILVEVLTIRSNVAERTHATLVGFLDSLIYNVQTAFQALIAANGLDAVTDLITHEVDLALKMVAEGKATPTDCRSQIVDYEIPFYQQQNLKWLLKFIHHMMTNAFTFGGNTDRLLRNLVDKSAFLGCIREIIVNVEKFGSLVWTHAVTILTDFLNNDPTSFSALSEANLIQCFLEALTGRPVAIESPARPEDSEPDQPEPVDDDSTASAAVPAATSTSITTDDRPHPLRGKCWSPLVLCLLLVMVVSCRAFDSFFEIFESPEHVRVMAGDLDIAANIGTSFDELARHHPDLRPAIANAVLDMIARVTYLGETKSKEPGWGSRLIVTDNTGKEMVADASLLTDPQAAAEKAEKGKQKVEATPTTDDADIEMLDAESILTRNARSRNENMSPHNSITPYIFATANFLANYITNVSLRTPLIQSGAIENLLDLCTSPSLPHDFGDSMAARSLYNVIYTLIEYAPIIGLPSLLKRTMDTIHVLQPMVDKSGFEPYFAFFLKDDLSVSSELSIDARQEIASGTSIVKALLNTQSLMRVLYQCFPFSSRTQTITLHPVNVYDYWDLLVKSLGPLLRSGISQNMAVERSVPESWSKSSGPAARRQGNASDPLVTEEDEAAPPDVLTSAIVPTVNSTSSENAPSQSEQLTPRFRNYQTLRVVLQSLMPNTYPLLQTLGKALLSRRGDRTIERDSYPRYRHIKLANSLADTVLGQVDVSERSLLYFNYWVTILHTVYAMLLDRKLEGRHSDRQGVQIIAPILVAFKQQGGLEKLNRMLQICSDEICADRPEGADDEPSRQALVVMKKILEIYAVIVNDKVVNESLSHYSFFARSGDRRVETPVSSNLLVELRLTILPVVRGLWESNLAEKVSSPILAKIIDTLKLISRGDSEANASKPTDKSPPPALLKATPVPFNWTACASTVSQLKDAGFEEGLAQEAAFRSNNQYTAAKEYCEAHKAKLAGSPNPVPAEEAPKPDELVEPMPPLLAPETSQAPSDEQMVLDLPSDLPPGLLEGAEGETLGDFLEQSMLGAAGADQGGAASAPAAPQASTADASSSTSPAQAPSAGPAAPVPGSQVPVPKEILDAQRATLRNKLIERCLDIIRAHPTSSYEVSELITAVVLQPSADDSAKQDVGETLVNALMSFAADDDLKSNGRSIAAYAHLLTLLLQDRGFFSVTISSLKENITEFLRFLQVPAPSTEDLPPWIPYILLIFEILLSDDEQPPDMQWKPPSSEDDSIEPFNWPVRDVVVNEDDRGTLLENILEILPRVGKDESMAISLLRILVILTRNRTTAKTVGDKKNLQRLFVMTKQLSGFGPARLSENRISTYVLTILRHIIEDEDIIKQLMRSEIRAVFDKVRTGQRPLDVPGYLRQLSHVALRDPKLFVSVTDEMVKLQRWTFSENGVSPRQHVLLKEPKAEVSKDDVAPTVRATEGLSIQDVKPSTEGSDKQVLDTTKPTGHDTKRPILENPDGVIHFLLCELLNYREVDDKEPPRDPKDVKDSAASPSSAPKAPGAGESSEAQSSDQKEKKPKASFKADEHPIFIYRCFLLRCLTELLQSYNRTKVEFINFKRSAPLQTNTPIKPRTSVLNYLLTDLLCAGNIDGTADSLADKKKMATAAQAQKLLVALVGKTIEKPATRSREKFEYDEEEPDLLFVRKFVIDTILKAYKDAYTSNEPFDSRYGKMLHLSTVMQSMVDDKEKDITAGSRNNPDPSPDRSQAQLRRLMYEKGYLAALNSSLADIDLAFPPVKKTIKSVLRVLRTLTHTAIQLSHANILPAASSLEDVEDDIASATSISDMEDDREETPDLYRNSALGMMEPGRDMEEDYSEGSDDDDEEMYEDEYDDEMEYDDNPSLDGEDNVSDEDEDVEGMGPMEGLPGDLAVVDVTMEDEDEDEDDEMDDSDDDMSEDDDDMDSEDMGDIEDRIHIVDDDGNPVEDDGASGWESESDEDVDDGEEDDVPEIDYEAEAQDLEEAQIHGLDDVGGIVGGRLGQMLQQHMGEGHDDDYDGHDEIHNIGNNYGGEDEEDEDEDEDDEDEMDEDDFGFDEYPNEPPPHGVFPLDALVLEQHGGDGFFAGPPRHRHGLRDHFPPLPFLMGRDHMASLGDTRNPTRPSGNEDGLNPLLRRTNEIGRDASPRPPNPSRLIRLLGAGRGESPISFINELLSSTLGSRHGNHALQFSITSQGPGGEVQELSLPLPHQLRGTEGRREAYNEPSHAAMFSTDTTSDRWLDEAKMIFGASTNDKAIRLQFAVLSHLIPPAIEAEKENKKREAEVKRRIEEEHKKREEEERKAREAREAQEAEEKAAKEKAEAEERERAEAAAAELAAQAATEAKEEDEVPTTDDVMEGVESTGDSPADAHVEAASDQPRVLTTIRGEQVDVTELGIDADYLEALPEEFREEVIAQTISQRRSAAREDAPRRQGEPGEVFQEFLDALPEDLRQEIVQQERAEQRRRDRDEARRQNAAPGLEAAPQDMDPASILMTFPQDLREQVLMEQGADIMDSLPPDLAAEARRLVRHHGGGGAAGGQRDITNIYESGRENPRQPPGETAEASAKPQRKIVAQMLDKSGVATLLRLMFINVKGGSLEGSLRHVFKDICESKQTRLEVISTLLQILQDGTTDVDAVERSFAQLSIKARQPKAEKDGKTPQSLKRSLTGLNTNQLTHSGSETSPVLIVQQCLDLLCYLAAEDVHVPAVFLTEQETVGLTLKRTLSRKGKGKESKVHKFAINSLLAMLDRDLVVESSSIMDSLSLVLSRITYPLLSLDKKLKEGAEAIKDLEKKIAEKENEPTSAPTAEAGEAATTSTDLKPETSTVQSSDASATQTAPPDPEATKTDDATTKTTTEDSITKLQERKQFIQKRIKTYVPPVIPVHNLTLIINIFVARECSSKTFKETLSAIKNLSIIPGAMDVFGEELARQARVLSEKIVVHLDELLPHIEKASTGTEIQGVALAKFSPGAADQNKLLRVLTALDHLFAQKKPESSDDSEPSNETKKQDLLATLYRNTTFNALWDRLSACLSAIRQRESLINVATILLPLIEALMVVCKDTTSSEALAQGDGSEMLLSSPPPESQNMASLFFKFTEEHRRILNELVRNNPSLMKGTFSHLVKNPKVLEFDNKRNYFNRSVHNRSQVPNGRNFGTLQLSVRREHVFHDSFRSLYFKSGDEMKFGKLNIRFHGEEGVDAGGVTREWFQVLSRQMFDPNYALFIPVSSDRTTFHPNKLSKVNDEHLMFFKFIGRVIGKALYEGRLLDCYFSRAVYKRILSKPVSVKDMESFDPEYYKSLVWMLENDITDIITESFAAEDDEFGVTKIIDLIKDGRDIPVTEENKNDYVRLIVEHKLLKSVQEQMENFLKGFHEIIPAELIAIFNEQELELLISGLPDIDVDDWKSNTEYHNYTPSSQQIQWFWRAVRSFDKEELAKLLQFVTGTSKVPLNGFKELEGMNGINRFNIHRDYGSKDRLPSSHTCFNQLDLPEYESYETLRAQVIKAITAGSDYFGFA
ncbi:uncharacterized protein PG998_010046 [Apiospora kogelbergensis]|uniref:uncharacterized protein n=1 Tax=Apiospora kogelbergensis TaxID=1337665 RepID=UPI00312F4903